MNTIDNWNAMAKAYEEFTESPQSYSYQIEWPCVKQLLPEIKGKKILDLGGGTGRFGILFSELHPVSVHIIDISERMISIGREKVKVNSSNIMFEKGDICNLNNLPDNEYDFIFSSTAFHYLADLNSAFNTVYRLLKKNCRAIISTMHPVYTGQYPIDKKGVFPTDDEWVLRYLDKNIRSYIQPWIEYNENIPDFLSSSYHHTISDYINAIIESGLRIDRIEEPLPPVKWKQNQKTRYDACIETPVYLIFSVIK